MNGIGNAFIWSAIASGPILLIVLALVAAGRRFRGAGSNGSPEAPRVPRRR